MKRSLFGAKPSWLLAASLLLCLAARPALCLDWPQEVDAEEGTIIIYQPQPESLSGNVLTGRAAMSLELKGQDEPVFGAFWFESRIDVDKAADTAMIRDLRVTDVRWPESNDAAEQRFTAIVEAAVPANGFEISFERLSASLETAQVERQSLENLNNDPPEIVFREELSVLVLYDGEPRYSPVEGSDYERVLNTPVVVVRRKGKRQHYLSSGRFWYEADNPMGPWEATSSPPADLVRMLPEPAEDGQGGPSSPPAIVTATVPTEVISTQGKPQWRPLQDGEILYVVNTESPWLRELSTNNMYVLLSGRWYRSKSTDGPWTFVRSDELPPAFANIPPASDIGGLRTSVAGTPEAQDAVLDAQIPQTTAIKRSEAALSVEYDGSPKFEKVPGTSVSYAVNTGAQVLEIAGRYYAVDNGVWFTAASASGPWVVADSIPQEEISKIPPSSPVYNTTHVHVYESTPEIVYVGYTPGYLWSFPYYGVPVYGTGWRYPPYYGSWYYPRPPTWGFNVGYNPWTGWNFGMSWSNGFFNFGISWGGGYGGSYRPWGCCGGWYGGGYRGPVVINTGDINIGNSVNIGNRTNIGNRIDRSSVNIDNSRNNIYKRPENRARNADRETAMGNLKQARPATDRANNVFADKNGNVARQVDDKWQTRENGDWKPADMSAETREAVSSAARNASPETRDRAATAAANARQGSGAQTRPATLPSRRPAQPQVRPSTRPSSRDFDRPSLDRSAVARQRGASRQMSRPQTMRAPARRGR